jgi:hypothetical protein
VNSADWLTLVRAVSTCFQRAGIKMPYVMKFMLAVESITMGRRDTCVGMATSPPRGGRLQGDLGISNV